MRKVIGAGEISPYSLFPGTPYLAPGKNTLVIMKRETYLDQHQHHNTWLNYLAFYKDEMQVLQKRLEEVAAKNTGHEVLAMVEHFQNQLILQREQHDILRHDIKQYENQIEKLFENNPVFAENSRPKEESELSERVETFGRLFHEMKEELYHFVARRL